MNEVVIMVLCTTSINYLASKTSIKLDNKWSYQFFVKDVVTKGTVEMLHLDIHFKFSGHTNSVSVMYS